MGTFSCPCVVRLVCSAWSRSLLKLSQAGSCWQAWKILGVVSEAERCWGLCFGKNNGIEPDGNI